MTPDTTENCYISLHSPIMNGNSLSTAADIINAYRTCGNAGEQIELFESLGKRPEPPLEALFELAKTVQLEPILALTLQELGKIVNPHIQENLRRNTELLAILSQKLQSGATDLIRWSAATTIENIGFDFVTISHHLTKEPHQVIQNITQDKLNRLLDSKLADSPHYDEIVRFWTYGDLDILREFTVGTHVEFAQPQDSWQLVPANNISSSLVCMQVMQNLGLSGIKMVHAALQRATEMGQNAFIADENELFEAIALQQALDFWTLQPSQSQVRKLLLSTQILCLQSNNSQTRKVAAVALAKLRKEPLWQTQTQKFPFLETAVEVFTTEFKTILELEAEEQFVEKIQYLLLHFSRHQVREDCQNWLNKLLKEIQKQKERLQKEKRDKEKKIEQHRKKAAYLRKKLYLNLEKISEINPMLYQSVFAEKTFEFPPDVSFEHKNHQQILNEYEETLKLQFKEARASIFEFYKSRQEVSLSYLKDKVSKVELEIERNLLILNISVFLFCISLLVASVYVVLSFNIFLSISFGIIFAYPIYLGVQKVVGDGYTGLSRKFLKSKISRLVTVRKKLASKRLKIENQQIEVLSLLEL